MNTPIRACAVTIALSFGWLLTPATTSAQTASAPAAAQASTQRTFPTADAAADTLTQALRGNDDKTIAAMADDRGVPCRRIRRRRSGRRPDRFTEDPEPDLRH